MGHAWALRMAKWILWIIIIKCGYFYSGCGYYSNKYGNHILSDHLTSDGSQQDVVLDLRVDIVVALRLEGGAS